MASPEPDVPLREKNISDTLPAMGQNEQVSEQPNPAAQQNEQPGQHTVENYAPSSGSGGGGGGGKIDSSLQQIIEEKPEQTTEVILHVAEGQSLSDVSSQITKAGGSISGVYAIGNIITARVPNNRIEYVVSNASVSNAWPERQVQVLSDGGAQMNVQSVWSAGYNGSGVKIAVLDTGIDSSHEILKGRVLLEKDFTGKNSPKDVFGHGTHVAGIIAGNGNVTGIARGALLFNAKVLDDSGLGSDIDVIRAINWAVDPDSNDETDDGADIISMSLGGLYTDPFGPISMALKAATERGVIAVAAAGNCGPCGSCGGFKGVTTPGASPYAITVGAVDENGQHACFSSGQSIGGVGVKPDVAAPGKNILSSVPGGYATKSGTSMATPHISGAIALLLQMQPGLNQSDVKQFLESLSKESGVPGKDIQYGSGLLDMGRVPYMMVMPEPAVLEYSNASAGFRIWNFAGRNLTIKNIICENCTTNFTGEIAVENSNAASFTLNVGEFQSNLPVHVETDVTNVTIVVTKLFETVPEMAYGFVNASSFEIGAFTPNISLLSLGKVYCDWADNGGNSLCSYYGVWKNLASRKPELGMNPGQEYNKFGDMKSGDKGGMYEEEDSFSTVGLDVRIADLSTLDVSYAAGAMDYNAGFGGCGVLEPGNCDVPNIKVVCDGTGIVDKDPCTLAVYPWCNNMQETTTCVLKKNSAYKVQATGLIYTKDANKNLIAVTHPVSWALNIACTKDSDCGGTGKCKITTDSRSTFCSFTDECTAGATECTSATKKRTCGDFDGNGYTEWGSPATCSPVAACHPDTCVSSLKNCPTCNLNAGYNYIKWVGSPASSDAAFKSIKDKLQETLYIGADDKWQSNPAAVVTGGIYTLKLSGSGTLTYEYCGDSICNNGEMMDSCPSDCGKKHSYGKFPSGWSADISSFDPQIYYGKDYSLKISYKCSADGYVYFPLDLNNTGNSVKFTCGDPAHDVGCQNEVLVKSYFTGSDCNTVVKERTLTFKIPSGSSPGPHNLQVGFWHGYDQSGKPKIDGSDGGYNSASGAKTVTVSEWKCTSNAQCTPEEFCGSEGTCKKDVCAPQGQNYCDSNNVYSCSSDGSSKSLTKTCSSDEACQSAACVKKVVCGNSICESGENYLNCASDCPSPCNDYCVSDTRYFGGTWSGGKCSYSSGLCTYGCFNGKCLSATQFPFTMSMEAAQGVPVYKQPGDYITFTFNSKSAQTIDFSPPSAFDYISGPYSAGKANLAAGATSVTFQIGENANGNYPVSAGNAYTKSVLWMTVTDEPAFLIVTNRNALLQRFDDSDKEKVSAVVQEAYSLAGKSTGKGVVYDLADYKMGARPWASFGEYKEKPLEPEKKDNAYASNVAAFVQKKCKSCKSVIILGDDFVVPMYRVDYRMFTGWEIPILNAWIGNNPQTKNIYSDFTYVPRDVKPIGDLNTIFEGINQNKGEKVIIIKPDGKSYSELSKLKAVLASEFSIKDSNIVEYESKSVACNEYGKLKGHTLILIGDRSSNNAIKCVPWFDAGKKPGDTFKASITLERNVWSAKADYAVVLSGDEHSAIATLTDFLENPGYYTNNFMKTAQTAYIHDFSKPQNMITGTDYLQGFVLGLCEHVGDSFIEQSPCIASDVTVSFLPGIGAVTDLRDFAIYCASGFVFDGDGMDKILCGVSGAGTATSIGTVLLAPTVVGAAVSETGDVALATTKGILKSLKAAMKSAPAFEKIAKTLKLTDAGSIKKFFQLGSGEGVEAAQKRFKNILTGPYRKFALNALGELDEAALKNGIKNADDLENAVRGSERILGSSHEGLKALPFSQLDNVKFLKSVGEAEKAFEISEKGLKGIKFVDEIEDVPNALAKFDPNNQIISISKSTLNELKDAGPNFLNRYAIFHE
ncbi:MAG: S8 family serine peptidase, partial [Candidatus Aenigmarchaeota archaeon]|nr:S8 family serine peptidase [Candidatus Aenigmarchaeota archaeon]